ncbi:MAG: ABC transporter ATP-binding protein [Rhodocyclaceae bacterium]|nr:ABC transporter ATP-binding protein [Rhodocyclaceae bacterium]
MTRMPPRFRQIVVGALAEMKAPLLVAAFALGGVMVTSLLAPWPLKVIFDHILLAKPLPEGLALLTPLLDQGRWFALCTMAGAIALIALFAANFAYLQVYATAKVGHFITYRLRSELFAHLQRLSMSFHQHNRSGELITKVASDTNLLRDMFAEWSLTFAAHFLTLIAMMAVMFVINWRLALVVATSLPPLLAAIYFLNKRVKASVRAQRRYEGAMTSRLNEVLSSMLLVQAFGRQSFEERRFQEEIESNFLSGVRTARNTGAITRAIVLVSAIGTAITVLVGAWQVLEGLLTPGELLIFLAYVQSLYKPVKDLGRLAAKFSRASVSAARVGEILATEPDAADPPGALDIGRPAGEIVFDQVSFGYRDDQPVVDGVSFRIAAGERVALVGPSGAGKSTLLSLLLRLYEPTAGRILVDGIDIARFRRDSLRGQIGIVLQENVLFGVSVRENIAYGCPDAGDQQIEAAARAARAHEFIVDLPDGYDTVLGERGATISGGQRQRICLARALVKEPAILVMDEPTSSVDAVSARLINESVARVHAGKTLLVIAHDYSDMRGYDRILVIKDGRLVESGRHEKLMEAEGAYLALVERRA